MLWTILMLKKGACVGHNRIASADPDPLLQEGTYDVEMKNEHDKPAVLVVHCRYRQRGGEDTVVENEIRLLREHGHRVFLYERDNAERFIPSSVFFSLKTYRDIRRIIKKRRIDIVHVHNTWMAMSPSVFYASAGMGVPVVQTLHNFRMICPNALLYRCGRVCEECVEGGMQTSVRYGCYRGSKLQTLVCALNTALHKRTGIYRRMSFICLTEFNRDKILRMNKDGRKYIDPDKVYIKPNFIWERPMQRSGAQDMKRDGFIFAGRLTEEKGVRVLVKAWALMGDKAPKLSIYGDGELRGWCDRIISKRGLNIDMMGAVDHDTLMDAVGRSAAMIFSSVLYEGFPMTVIEAYAMGTPVIAGDRGNGKQFIEDGKNGLIFRTGEASDLARAVRDMTEGRAVFDEEDISLPAICTPEENYRVLAGIYDKLLSDRH